MELIGKPETKTLWDLINSLNPDDIEEICIATAYINRKGFNFIKKLVEKVNTKIVVCLDPSVTDWEPLQDMIRLKSINCRHYKPTSNTYFHPKMYILKYKSGEYDIILGSSNLTHGGLRDNIEANLYFEHLKYSDAKDFLAFFDKIFKDAKPLTLDIINKFRTVRDKYIENQRKWRAKIQRTKAKELIPSTTLLTSGHITKVKKILEKEKKKYITWFRSQNHCRVRKEHIDNIKKYASEGNWIKLFDEVWSVSGLRRGALARSSVFVEECGRTAFRTKEEISQCLARINENNLRDWISYIQRKDWNGAIGLSLHGISEKIQSELFCVYHGDEYGIKNDKSIRALKYLLGDPEDNFSYKSYDSMPYSYFNSLLNELVQLYLEVIGRQCNNIPILLELDSFFWYLYENRKRLNGYE